MNTAGVTVEVEAMNYLLSSCWDGWMDGLVMKGRRLKLEVSIIESNKVKALVIEIV